MVPPVEASAPAICDDEENGERTLALALEHCPGRWSDHAITIARRRAWEADTRGVTERQWSTWIERLDVELARSRKTSPNALPVIGS